MNIYDVAQNSDEIMASQNIYCPICGDKRRKFLFVDKGFPVWRCLQCSHMYVSPQPSRYDMANFYTTRSTYGLYERHRFRLYDAAARAIVKYMPHRGDLLDVGCSFGGFMSRAAKDGWTLSGIEPSVSGFMVCQKRFGAQALLQQVSFEQAQLTSSSFDCVVMLNVIEHVHEPRKICKRAFQILRPGGCLVLRWPQYSFRRRIHAPSHLHGFTRRSIERLFRLTGFTDVREYWADIVDYRDVGFKRHLRDTALRLMARAVFCCTFGKHQIPFVSRLTLGRKPQEA